MSGTKGSEHDVLVCLLNYKRPENLRRAIAAWRQQSVAVRIAVWNNGDPAERFEEADYLFHSPENLICLPRWHVAALLGREYIAVMDDDLIPTDPELTARCIAASRAYNDERILGRSGMTIGAGPQYYSHGNADAPQADRDVFTDVVKGRFMFMHASLLQRVPLYNRYYDGRGDDIWVSLKTSRSRGHHVLPAGIKKRVKSSKDEHGLVGQGGHWRRRDKLVSDLLEHGEVAWVQPDLRHRGFGLLWRVINWAVRVGLIRRRGKHERPRGFPQ